MAIFSENEELDRQGVHKPMDKVRGMKKVALAALGYKDSGEKNMWGRINMALPNPVFTVGSHHLAKGIAGRTDTGKVLKETSDENTALAGAQLKTAIEGVKMFATGGVGGAAGGGALGGVASGITGGDTNAITSAISGSGSKALSGEGVTQTLTKFGAKPSEFLTALSDDNKSSEILNELDKGVEDNSLLQEEEEEKETEVGQTNTPQNKLLTGITNVENTLGNLSPLISAGVQQFGAAKSYKTSLENEAKKHKYETKLTDNANII
jgi:outer membrane lipoprotein SlyB